MAETLFNCDSEVGGTTGKGSGSSAHDLAEATQDNEWNCLPCLFPVPFSAPMPGTLTVDLPSPPSLCYIKLLLERT